MTVFSKRNILLPSPDGQKIRLEKGKEVSVPAWAEKSAYLKALEADQKVILIQTKLKKKPNVKNPKEEVDPPPETTGGEV